MNEINSTFSKIIVSHPTGNQNVRAVIEALSKANCLDKFCTSLSINLDNPIFNYLSPSLKKELARRTFPVNLDKILSFPYIELLRLFSQKTGMNSLFQGENAIANIDSVYKNLDRNVAKYLKTVSLRNKINAVYAYEDGALSTFLMAKEFGIKCYYDLPIGYWRAANKILSEEKKHFPEWWDTLPGFKDSEYKLARKDKELNLANHIFVASSFTATTLNEYPDNLAPLTIIPYGFPEVNFIRNYDCVKNRPLKLLFVGSLTQRKGIAYLFKAMESFKKEIELTIVGSKPSTECVPLNSALKRYKWIPSLSHNEILEIMRVNDVLIFPSLFEGFGLVITEAMSQGTPVITTNRTAGPDLIDHGINGWLIEAGSSLAIEKILNEILEDTDNLKKIGIAAMETAKKRPWSKYGKELMDSINIHS